MSIIHTSAEQWCKAKIKGSEMSKFETGKTYTTRSIGDYDCIISVTIEKRTEKTVTAKVMGKTRNFRVTDLMGSESFKPWGNYSMCPVIRAA